MKRLLSIILSVALLMSILTTATISTSATEPINTPQENTPQVLTEGKNTIFLTTTNISDGYFEYENLPSIFVPQKDGYYDFQYIFSRDDSYSPKNLVIRDINKNIINMTNTYKTRNSPDDSTDVIHYIYEFKADMQYEFYVEAASSEVRINSLEFSIVYKDNIVISMNYIPTSEIIIRENYDDTYKAQLNDKIELKYSDETTVTYTYKEDNDWGGFAWFDENNYPEYVKPLFTFKSIEKNNYYEVSWFGVVCLVPVTITENPIEKIEYSPINGYYDISDYINIHCEEYEGVYAELWTNNLKAQEGDILTVYYKNGTVVTIDAFGKNIILIPKTTKWYKDETISLTLTYKGHECSVPVAFICSHDWRTLKEATCVSQGEIACVWCKKINIIEIDSNAHEYEGKITYPTCSVIGYITYTCINCGDTFIEEYYPDIEGGDDFTVSHNYDDGTIIKKPSCIEQGVIKYTCLDCKESYLDILPLTNHAEVIDEAVAPSCTETGLSEGSHCSVCNEILVAQTEIDVIGHNHTCKITTPATCIAEGVTTYTCTCGDTYTESIEKLAHNIATDNKKATYFEAGYENRKVCKNCHTVISEGSVVKKLKLTKPTVKVKGGKKKVIVKYSKVKDATGFEVKYKTGKKIVRKKFKTNKSTTKTINKLIKGTYKIQIRTYIKKNGKVAYSSWLDVKKIKIK